MWFAAVMRILILGGTAWLGAQIASMALSRGHAVTCLARGHTGQPPEDATFVQADRDTPGAYDAVAEQEWDAVVDVSWQPGQVRSAVTALAHHCRRWVYVSSCSVYAEHDTPGADEGAPLLPALEGELADDESYGEAKVACEQIVLTGIGEGRSVIARSGLIGGPGDHSDRTGYWPMRFARPASPDGAVLVPDTTGATSQLVDVRDLASWLVRCVEEAVSGVFNTTAAATPLADTLAAARSVSGHRGPLVVVGQEWLLAHDVEPYMGPRSLPLWLPLPEYAGWAARDTSAAREAGLVCRPVADTFHDLLAWELTRDPDRPRRAGLTAQEEAQLIDAARKDHGPSQAEQAIARFDVAAREAADVLRDRGVPTSVVLRGSQLQPLPARGWLLGTETNLVLFENGTWTDRAQELTRCPDRPGGAPMHFLQGPSAWDRLGAAGVRPGEVYLLVDSTHPSLDHYPVHDGRLYRYVSDAYDIPLREVLSAEVQRLVTGVDKKPSPST